MVLSFICIYYHQPYVVDIINKITTGNVSCSNWISKYADLINVYANILVYNGKLVMKEKENIIWAAFYFYFLDMITIMNNFNLLKKRSSFDNNLYLSVLYVKIKTTNSLCKLRPITWYIYDSKTHLHDKRIKIFDVAKRLMTLIMDSLGT